MLVQTSTCDYQSLYENENWTKLITSKLAPNISSLSMGPITPKASSNQSLNGFLLDPRGFVNRRLSKLTQMGSSAELSHANRAFAQNAFSKMSPKPTNKPISHNWAKNPRSLLNNWAKTRSLSMFLCVQFFSDHAITASTFKVTLIWYRNH